MRYNQETCNSLFNSLPLIVKRQIANIIEEYHKAIQKHPQWPVDFIHAAAIVGEESGELIQAALQHRYENGQYYNLHKEAIQTGAMALRFLIQMPNIEFGSEHPIFEELPEM